MNEFIMQETEEMTTFGSVWKRYEPVAELIRCKDCKHRGNSEKCVLSAISEEKDFPLFILDNRGDWFCADGVAGKETVNE